MSSLLSNYGCAVVYKQNFTGDRIPLCLMDVKNIARTLGTLNDSGFSSKSIDNFAPELIYQVAKDVLYSSLALLEETDKRDIAIQRIDLLANFGDQGVITARDSIKTEAEPIEDDIIGDTDGVSDTGVTTACTTTPNKDDPVTDQTEYVSLESDTETKHTPAHLNVEGCTERHPSDVQLVYQRHPYQKTGCCELTWSPTDAEVNQLNSTSTETSTGDAENELSDVKVEEMKLAKLDKKTRKRMKPKTMTSCPVCDQQVTNLEKHMRIHTGKQPFQCNVCGARFKYPSGLRAHAKVHAGGSGGKSHQCYVCGKLFSSKDSLKIHAFQHVDNKPFTCSHCGKGFTSQHIYIRHMRIHTKEKPFLCATCGKAFTQKNNMETHEERHHQLTRYKCLLCEKSFKHKYDFNQHSKEHLGKTPYKCSQCDKAFVSEYKLKDHEFIHTGRKKFGCSFCDKTFMAKTAMRAHENTHTGRKPHQCPLCERAFASNIALWHHRKIHEEKRYECLTCGKQYAYKPSLEIHIRTHTGEKPYTCAQCGKSFMCSGSFRNHKKLHLKKPFMCMTCSKLLRTEKDLNAHLATHV